MGVRLTQVVMCFFIQTSTTSQSRNNQTVASYFRFSLMDLLSKMVAGTPHFVRYEFKLNLS